MKKQYIGLIAVLALILIVTFSFIIYNQWPLMTGKRIVLATQPIDPFDPFRGQYITINYEISRITDIDGLKEGDFIYVILKEDKQGIWRKDSVSKSKPESKDFIRGEVVSVDGNTSRIKYGIEQYFFERNAILPRINITSEIMVADSGRAKLVQLLYNGEPAKLLYEKVSITS